VRGADAEEVKARRERDGPVPGWMQNGALSKWLSLRDTSVSMRGYVYWMMRSVMASWCFSLVCEAARRASRATSARAPSALEREVLLRDCERERRTRFLVRSFAEGADAGILMTFFHRSADEESESGENCLSSCAAFSAISPCEESARARREARKR
jgi:hypothetical protein